MKSLVLYSGGLDSRLVVCIMKKYGDVCALYFNLPFGCNCSIKENEKFAKSVGAEFRVIDVCKNKLLKEYLEHIKNAKFGYGRGFNPCTDCKVWMFQKAKQIFDKENFDVFATGEVLNQRPMSQIDSRRRKIDSELNFDILRPLSAKVLPETIYEKNGLVDRNQLYAINGRRRIVQMELAKEFGIDYPTPAGGCLLCEKLLKKRFECLIKNNMINEGNFNLVKIGRHFIIDDNWYIVARNSDEGEILCQDKNHFIMGEHKKPTIWFLKEDNSEIPKKLREQYSSNKHNNNSEFEKFLL